MSEAINQRINVTMEDDFVVFQLGFHINHIWRLHNWIPAALAMPTMINEFSYILEKGFLGYQLIGSFPSVIVQYWKSLEDLEAYTSKWDEGHYPAWKAYIQKIVNNNDVGIWHETYKVKAGKFEDVKNQNPIYGLDKPCKLAMNN